MYRGRHPALTAVLTVLSGVASAAGEDRITPTGLLLEPTFQNVGVVVRYSGDANFNATGSIRYRKAGTDAWRTGHPLLRISDRTMTVSGEGARNPRFATSLFYLEEGTAYDVEVRFRDPDGVVQQLAAGRVTTRTSNVPVGGGKDYYVDAAAPDGGDGSRDKPFNSLAGGLRQGGPGDTIHFRPGVYCLDRLVSPTIAGRPGAWLHIVAEPGAIITDADPAVSGVGKLRWQKFRQDVDGHWIYRAAFADVQRVLVRRRPGEPSSGYFLWKFHARSRGPDRGQTLEHMIQNTTNLNRFGTFLQDERALYLTLPKGMDDPAEVDFQITRDPPRRITFVGHHVLVEGFTLEATTNIKVRPRPNVDGSGQHYIFRRLTGYGAMAHGFWIGDYGLIEDCRFTFNALWDWLTGPQAKDKNKTRGWFKIKGGVNDTFVLVLGSHTVCRYNAIRGHSNAIMPGQRSRNVDIHNNLIAFTGDDGIEPDGIFINGRAYQNKLVNVFNCFSDAPISVGPGFVFRNVFWGYHQGAIKIRNGAGGVALYYHNTCYPLMQDLRVCYDVPDGASAFAPDPDGVVWMKTRNNIFIGRQVPYRMTISRIPQSKRDTLDYDRNALWGLGGRPMAPFGEEHSVKALPVFVDAAGADMRLKTGDQPCVDAGQRIPGINDDVPDRYRFKGKAPDLGAYEYGRPVPHYGPRPRGRK